MKVESRIGLAVAAALCLVGSAHAATVNRVVLKASDTTAQSGTTVVDPYEDWAATVGVNEGVTGADAIANNGIDFKDSWVDSNWGLVDSVRVSMHADVQGQLSEVAYFEFDAHTRKFRRRPSIRHHVVRLQGTCENRRVFYHGRTCRRWTR